MSTALIIATREIRERSRLFIVAAVLAFVPFLVAAVQKSNGAHRADTWTIGAAAAVTYAVTVALMMGVSVIGRDLAEKRLSFYFSKPVSPAALWIGKAGASLLSAIVCALIIAVPSILAGRTRWESAWLPSGPTIAVFTLIVVLAVFLGGHAISTMARSRSILVAVDFVLATAMLGVVAMTLRPILVAGGREVAKIFGVALFSGLLLILAVAPVWQLAKGRTDVRRSHAALSKFLWTSVAVLLLFAGGFAIWLRSVSPSELVDLHQIEQSPAGGWALITGQGANRGDFHSTFLMDTKTGEYSRLASPPWSGVLWSRDGRVAAWMQPVGFVRIQEFELYTRVAGSTESRASGIRAPGWTGFALSDDGSRVAVGGHHGLIAVHDLQSQRLLVSVKVDDASRAYMFFTAPGRLRILQYDRLPRGSTLGLRIYELDVQDRKLTKLGERVLPDGNRSLSVSGDGSRAFARTTGEIVDGRTLAPIAKIVDKATWASAMLNDGSLVIVDKTNGVTIRLFDRDGQPLGEVKLPNMKSAALTAETTDNKLLFAAGQTDGVRSMIVVDRNRLVVERVVSDVSGPYSQWFVDPRTARYEAGQPFAGIDAKGKLKVWRN